MTKYDEFLARARRRHGDRFSESGLDPRFVRYFNSGERIRVDFGDGLVKTGTVGVTTGWQPCFLLMLRRDSDGSSWTLGRRDTILAVQRHGVYVGVS